MILFAVAFAAATTAPVVNGTSRAERAAAPDMRFASAAEAKGHCEPGTIRRLPGGNFECSSAGRPIVRTRTRHSGPR